MTSDRLSKLPIAAATVVVAAGFVAFGFELGAEETESAEDRHAEAELEEIPAADNVAVIYRGTLETEEGTPVSGVLPLTFNLYRGDMSADALWSETHYVSVVDGRYQVPLGYESPLREHLLVGQPWIGIELEGRQILRDRLTVDHPGDDSDRVDVDGERVAYADVAERAAEAERARVADEADSLDGRSADEIVSMVDQALDQLAEHVADPDAHQAVTGPSVGTRKQKAGDEAGGTGGSSYEIHCPEGYVATGIEGGAGRVVDSITLLCSPLE